MGLLDNVIPIGELSQGGLWGIYGKSNSGKTTLISTFPKPILYLQIGDDGTKSISDVENIDVLRIDNPEKLKTVLTELKKNYKYATIVVDTYSMIVNEWQEENIISKKKKMTMQAWGDVLTEQNTIVKQCQVLSQERIVVLTCHEVTDTIEGMEDEITPDVRPNVSKGARTYFEGMCNYGIHTTVLQKEVTNKETGETSIQTKHAVHLGSNPYYWTKTQKPSGVKLPRVVLNPTYEKLVNLIAGTK